MPRTGTIPLLALVVVTAIWGYTFVPVQKAVAVYPLFAFLAVRFAISTVTLAPFAWRPLRALPRGGWAAGLGAGTLLAAAYGLQTAGLELTTVTSTGFITGLYVVFTPLIALAAFRTPVPAPVWIGVVLSLAGLMLLSGAPGGSWVGNLLVLGNAVAQSLQIVSMERFAPRYDARALTFLQMTVAFAGFTVVAVATGQVEAPPDAQTWYALVVTGVFAGALGYLVATWVQSRTTAARAALVFTLEAPFAALFGVLLLSETLGWAGWLGCAVMLTRHRPRGARGRLRAPAPRPGPVERLVDAVVLALVSAALFGAMPVAVRFALVPPMVPAAVGALFMQIATFAVLCVAAAIQGGVTLAGIAPFLLAGAIAPGVSNLFITVGIREAGSSRASVAFGMAPLFAVTIAVLVFDERPGALVLFGAVLIVCGGVALALEPERPRHVRRIGIAFALVGAALFALRDNLVRDESLDTEVPSMTAGAAMLASGLVVTSIFVLARRHRVVWPARVVGRWLLPGAFVGLSYIALFEAFYRGTVSVVAPIVATESLFGVLFSALLLRRTERVGPRLVLGAALVVTGGALIAVFR